MIGKEKSDFSFRISWHLYAHKCSNQFVSYIQLKLFFLSIETTVVQYRKEAFHLGKTLICYWSFIWLRRLM